MKKSSEAPVEEVEETVDEVNGGARKRRRDPRKSRPRDDAGGGRRRLEEPAGRLRSPSRNTWVEEPTGRKRLTDEPDQPKRPSSRAMPSADGSRLTRPRHRRRHEGRSAALKKRGAEEYEDAASLLDKPEGGAARRVTNVDQLSSTPKRPARADHGREAQAETVVDDVEAATGREAGGIDAR